MTCISMELSPGMKNVFSVKLISIISDLISLIVKHVIAWWLLIYMCIYKPYHENYNSVSA